jgi:hypothetical protein
VKQTFGVWGLGCAECYRRQATSVLVASKEAREGGAIVRVGDFVPLQKLLLLGRILFSLFLQPVFSICSPLQTLARTPSERYIFLL